MDMTIGGASELLEGVQALLFLCPVAGGVDSEVGGDLGLPDGELRSIAVTLVLTSNTWLSAIH